MLEKFSLKKKKIGENVSKEDINLSNVPRHVAIIMDGNGRWAKKRGLPRMAGHHEGMKTVKQIVKFASDIGIKVLTLYAFSTENWKRPENEVNYLMKLPGEFLDSFLPSLIEENVKVQTIGNTEKLPKHTLEAVNKAIEDTKDNTGLILNFALNYGSRHEILNAVTDMIEDIQSGKVNKNDISENLFETYLMTKGLEEPDLLIRTSGEQRLSNFMLWQLAYAEFVFSDVLWPDFKEENFTKAIMEFQNRGRRFGGI